MRYRWTGLGTPFGSLQWERKDDDEVIARRVISLLEDRRLLFVDFYWETPSDCIVSAGAVRDKLSEMITNPDISTGLAQQLKLLRSYFRTFMETRDDHGRRYHMGHEPFSVALGELRAKVGQLVGDLAARFELDVEPDLASIVPTEEGGFFASVLKPD
ncbi:DUF6650 family protein [Aestuariimicrobium ganziense]|uniref:DUF6650 family protein n=1 Tax=Aestuariimicrobium ganziense TaxID=2773677 RepID=UPI0019428972|nr:DUF6650 family protein [Aestuariimicrobium ganziense]